MYRGHKKEPKIISETIAYKIQWIWHAFFDMPASHNDINVLQRSPIFARLAEGEGPQVTYNINGHDYSMGYYLADDIYSSWATFVKTIPEPQGNKIFFLQRHKKRVQRMLSGRLGFYNRALLLFVGRLVCRMKTRSMIVGYHD